MIAALVTGCHTPPAGSTLVFGDEFSGLSIDRAKWIVYTGPVYNAELQAYVDDTATAYVRDGMLVLQARARAHRDTAGRAVEFVSARLHGRTTFRYGTIAARMKLPTGAGLWPAFWLLGEGAWPAHGEIDVMEYLQDLFRAFTSNNVTGVD
ncbi:glycoside hydrolase family 16 protein [Roseisolibacter agri]|uniref:glycoside hydrolase family 16 protein n=1 Tax=Roseisolibacter agri TaxID=2014610 RepID=UPI0024E14DEF|nr:glycoside hydrolase family 16 protein [Roseisolibacter agri]